MDSLYLLLPLSVLLVLALIALFAWALDNGQFDDLDREGQRILEDYKPSNGLAEHTHQGKVPAEIDLDQTGKLPSQKN